MGDPELSNLPHPLLGGGRGAIFLGRGVGEEADFEGLY